MMRMSKLNVVERMKVTIDALYQIFVVSGFNRHDERPAFPELP